MFTRIRDESGLAFRWCSGSAQCAGFGRARRLAALFTLAANSWMCTSIKKRRAARRDWFSFFFTQRNPACRQSEWGVGRKPVYTLCIHCCLNLGLGSAILHPELTCRSRCTGINYSTPQRVGGGGGGGVRALPPPTCCPSDVDTLLCKTTSLKLATH